MIYRRSGDLVQPIITGLSLEPTGLLRLSAIDVDMESGKIYWTEPEIDEVRAANLDGSDIETLISAAFFNLKPTALDYHAATNTLWVTDSSELPAGFVGRDRVIKYDLDSNNAQYFSLASEYFLTDIVYDDVADLVYISDFGFGVSESQIITLDPSTGLTSEETVLAPTGLALDSASRTLAWISTGGDNPNLFNVRNLDTGQTTQFSWDYDDPSGLAFDATTNTYYFLFPEPSTIWSNSLDSGSITQFQWGSSPYDIEVLNLSGSSSLGAPPQVTSVPDQEFQTGSYVDFDAAGYFSDPDISKGDELSFEIDIFDGDGQLIDPDWLTFDEATGRITGTPATSDVGTFALRVTAEDLIGNRVSAEFSITVWENEVPEVSLENIAFLDINEGPISVDTKVADIVIKDEGRSTNEITLSGADAALFKRIGNELYLAAGSEIDFESNPQLDVTVEVTDTTLDPDPIDTVSLQIDVNDVNEAPTVNLTTIIDQLPEDVDVTAPIRLATINISDDALGTNNVTLSGNDKDVFEIIAGELYLKANTSLNFEFKDSYDVTVEVNDASIAPNPNSSADFNLTLTDVNEAPTVRLENIALATINEGSVATSTKVADIIVEDDALGNRIVLPFLVPMPLSSRLLGQNYF